MIDRRKFIQYSGAITALFSTRSNVTASEEPRLETVQWLIAVPSTLTIEKHGMASAHGLPHGRTLALRQLDPYPGSLRFPYVVPANRVLLITDIAFSAKFNNSSSALFSIADVLTVASHVGTVNYTSPIKLGPGSRLDGSLDNNAGDVQRMNICITGRLLPN